MQPYPGAPMHQYPPVQPPPAASGGSKVLSILGTIALIAVLIVIKLWFRGVFR